MNLRATLNGYFEETQIPDELEPDKAAAFIKPRPALKKAAEIHELPEAKPAEKAAAEPVQVKTAPIAVPSPKAEPPVPLPVPKVKAAPAAAPVTGSEVSANAAPDAKEDSVQPSPEITASAFIKIVRHHHLTGSEFLSLLGNSKISNKAYQEIAENPGLTVKRLIEILEASPLTSEDYEKLVIAVRRTAQLKEEAKEKLNAKSAQAAADVPQKQEASDEKPDIDANKEEKQEAEADGKKSEKAPVKIDPPKADGDKDGDDEDDSEDDEDDDEEKKRSNKGKFIIVSAAAVILIAISFGLRYYFTGSLLPFAEAEAEQELTYEEIFEALSGLEPQTVPAFSQNSSYTAGGSAEEQALTNVVITDRRLVYYTGSTLYIFEQIGGQLEQLSTVDYGSDSQLLGLVQLDEGIAVVTADEGEGYSFSYTLPDEEGMDTVVNGTVQRPETVIYLLDINNPEKTSLTKTVRLSGELAALWTENGRIAAVTWEGIAQGAAQQDAASYMPYIKTSDDEDGKLLCSAEDVLMAGEPSRGSFVTVFSLDFANGEYALASAAGGNAQLVSKSGTSLFIGQGSLLIRYDIGSGIRQNGFCTLSGSFAEFSAIGVYDDEIRAITLENGSAALTVLDSELSKLSEVKNAAAGEVPAAVCFNGRETYIITESGMLYGIDGENNSMSESSVNITNAKIYRWSDTVGIKVSATGTEDKRTGLIISACALDGSLETVSEIAVNSSSVAENALDEYISSPAENDASVIGGSSENGVAVIPVVYFDGISEVELFVIVSVSSDGVISLNGSVCEYDRNSSFIFAAVNGDTVICVTDGKIVTAKAGDGSIIGYFTVS